MRKGWKYLVLIGAGVLVVVGLLVCGLFREREPEYGGKRLSEWVQVLGAHAANGGDAHLADEAIRHIGTNALPYLLKWLSYETPNWKFKLYEIVDKTVKKRPDDWFVR